MAKAQLELTDEQMMKINILAVNNGRKTNKQELVNLALEVANLFIRFSDSEDFEQITGLKK